VGVEGFMTEALWRRGSYRQSSDHQWVGYYTINEKQIVVIAVEYLYLNVKELE
jgi:hypothetical protein